MRRRGFTIVELICVTAILAMLIGLLLPALARVRGAGRSTLCLSNLRQMTLAAQQYAAIYDAWPAALRYENDGVHVTIAWDWIQETGGELLRPGPLWSFTDDPGAVQQCPAYHGESSFGADPHTGYNYNTSYVGARAPSLFTYGWDDLHPGVPPHACRRSGQCAMFGDGGRAGGTNKFMRGPVEGDLILAYNGGQSFRHLGSTNVAFIDGHVTTAGQAHEGVRATADLLENHLGFPDNGFLSTDDTAYDPR